ncbi:Tudor/PWWP/MBT superfamily protein [Hirschfeldia incana]|nr:Tudor/PWWP/MBT superfamily protein [Hirschfeldia incana]
MGSSDERNSKAIDASVGGLVWVRRRNGSWWPGRIMAHHEVPDDTIVSPKSGTPIKLLGRDDAGVDWYNLEKSKRVKAFRCGEYDACIETAKATATGKKPVKYARREDAIVHALEIENALLLVAKEDDSTCVEKASTSSDSTDVAKTEEVALRSSSNGKKASKVVQPLSEKRRRRRTPNDSEDDGSEGNKKRMRGLEDIGIGTIGSKEKAKQEDGLVSDIVDINNGSLPNGILAKDSNPLMKGKRSPVVNANENSKKNNQRRPVKKVLESTTMVSVPVTCDELVSSDCPPAPRFSENKVSAVNNDNLDSNGVSCENDDVSLNASGNVAEVNHNKAKESEISSISVLAKDEVFDVPLLGEQKYSAGTSAAGFTSSPTKALTPVSEPTRQCDDVVKTEGCNGSACTTIPAVPPINGIEDNTSKWQVKGKRNPRQMSKKQEERRITYAEEANNNSLPHYSLSPQLYDVKIEEKGSYKPRNVPLISLRSKLDGEAIVGHPSTVEVLGDGSCDRILCSHIKSLVVPMVTADVKAKPSWKNKSKKKKLHIPPHKSSKSKKSSSLSIKTRCLSALSGHKLTVSGSKKRVMTREGIVSCIPLKVVFSRINEAVKGSGRQVHRALPST